MADTQVTANAAGSTDERGIFGPYWINSKTGIIIYADDGSDISYARTTDGGATWSITEIDAGSVRQISCFFDREVPGDTGNLIHMAWIDGADTAGSQDCFYRTLDVKTETLGTQRTVIGTLTVSGNARNNRVAVTKTVSGNIIVAFETSTEIGCHRSTDLFASNNDVVGNVFELAAEEDWVLMFPANTGDNDDACALFLDRSAATVSLKMFDQSADTGNGTWTETAISSSIVSELRRRTMDGAIRHSDKHLLMLVHVEEDTVGDDLLTWDLTVDSIGSPTVTSKANILTDTAESGAAAMIINQQNDDVYVSYVMGTVFQTDADVFYQLSQDGMGAWDGQVSYSEATDPDVRIVHGGRTIGDGGGRIQFCFDEDNATAIFVNLNNDVKISGGGSLASLGVGT